MPYTMLENVYATLSEEEQKEVFDFVLFLVAKKQNQEKSVDFSFVDNIFATLSDEEAKEMKKHCNFCIKEELWHIF